MTSELCLYLPQTNLGLVETSWPRLKQNDLVWLQFKDSLPNGMLCFLAGIFKFFMCFLNVCFQKWKVIQIKKQVMGIKG